MEALWRDNQKRMKDAKEFEEWRSKLDWVREYTGEYGAEVLAFEKDGSLFVGSDDESKRPVTLGESVEWMVYYEYAGRLGIESDDNMDNLIRWLRLVAVSLRANE